MAANTTMSDMVATAISAIRRERSDREVGTEVVREVETQSTSDDDFSADRLYRWTINSFSPRQSQQGVKRRRGRPTKTVQIKMFMLDAPAEMLPSLRNRKRLNECGLGIPKMPSSDIIRKSWSVRDLQNHIVSLDLQNHIVSLYPGVPLELVGFHVAKCTKARQLVRIEIESVMQLKKEIGKGVMFIIPKNKVNSPQDNNGDESPQNDVSENSERSHTPEASETASSTPHMNPADSTETSSQGSASPVPSTSRPSNSDASLPVISAPQRREPRAAARNVRRTIRHWCNRSSIASPGNISLSTETATSNSSTILDDNIDSVIEIVDSEDEALQMALEGSLQEQTDIQEIFINF